MAQYDIHNIEQRLQQYDDNVRRIDFDNRNGMHRVICWDPKLYEEYIAMSVPAGELDARVERRVMEINPQRFNAIEEVNRSMAEKEQKEERRIEDMARDMADTLDSSFRLKPSRTIE